MIRVLPFFILTLFYGQISAQSTENEPKEVNCRLFRSHFTEGIYSAGQHTFYKLNKLNSFVRRTQGDYGPGDTFSLVNYLDELKTKVVQITYPIDSQFKHALNLCDSMRRNNGYRELGKNEMEIELFDFSYVNNEIVLSYGYLLPRILENNRVQTRRVIVLLRCTPDLKPIEYYCNGWLQGEGPESLAYDPETKTYFTHGMCDQKDKTGSIYWFNNLSFTKNNWTLTTNKTTMVSPSLIDMNYMKCRYQEQIRDIKIGRYTYFWLSSSPVLYKPGDIIPIFSSSASPKYLPSRFIQGIEPMTNGQFKVVFSYQYNDKRKIGYSVINDKLEVLNEMVLDRDFDKFFALQTYTKNGQTILIMSKSDQNGEHLYELAID